MHCVPSGPADPVPTADSLPPDKAFTARRQRPAERRSGRGNDWLSGGDGRDLQFGGAGHDLLAGGNGADVQVDGPGWDALFGGRGFDWQRA